MPDFRENGYAGARRTRATFLLAPEPPVIGEAYRKLTFRQRMDVLFKQSSTGTAVPGIVYVLVVVKIFMYLGFFRYVIYDTSQDLFSERNMKKFLLYNILGDVTGCNSTNGVLGFRFRLPFVSWWNFLKPGTLTCPLMPCLPNRRQLHLVLLYVAYLCLLLWAMAQKEIGFHAVLPPLVCLALILPQDLVIFQASRGEHYIYFLFCALFSSEQFLFGCQTIQIALWFWAGLSKVGPWFKYVTSSMSINSVLLRPFPSVLKLLHSGAEDASPSALANCVSHLGTLLEIALGPLCAFVPAIGVPVTIGFHLYIFSMVPFASVMEWNVLCILSCYYHFRLHVFAVPVELHPVLLGFLATVLVVVPLVGQLFPKLVPFLIAYRPYAGNWRFCWHVVAKKAKEKLRLLKTMDSVYVTENAAAQIKVPEQVAQFDDQATAACLIYPHFRPLVPLVEELELTNGWTQDDYVQLSMESFFNAAYGWCLGTGFYAKASHFSALHAICGFEPGECYVVICEPHGLLSRTSEWSVWDVAAADEPVTKGSAPYAELEKYSAAGMPRSALQRQEAGYKQPLVSKA